MAYEQDVAERVWAETRRLVAASPTAEPDLRRLQAGLGLLAGRLAAGPARQAEFPRREDAPRITDVADAASFAAMTAAIESGVGGDYAGVPLPGVIALVKLTSADKPDLPDGGFPKWLTTVVDTGAVPAAIFALRDDPSGRRYGVYERLAAARVGERPFVSDLTGTGTTPMKAKRTAFDMLAWILVWVALAVGLVSAAAIWGQGARLARTHAILSGADSVGFDKLQAGHVCRSDDPFCSADNRKFGPDEVDLTKCLKPVPQPTPAPSAPGAAPAALPFASDRPALLRYSALQVCRDAWRAARNVEKATSKEQLDGYWVLGRLIRALSTPGAESPVLFWPLVGFFAGIVALSGAVGLGGYRRVFGLWINNQYRFSLSTAQISMWTGLVIAPFCAIALLHSGMGLPSGAVPPGVPGLLFALMGISFTSTLLAKYILAVKGASTQGRSDDGIRRFIMDSTGLARNDSPRKATIMDFFYGEEESNRDQLDVSRFQNVVFTIVLGVSYFAAIVAMLESASLAEVLGAFRTPQPLFSDLPDVTGSFLGLLLISHAAYLTIKAASKGKPENSHDAAA